MSAGGTLFQGFPVGFQLAFYAIPAVVAIVGVALIAAGIYVICKFKNRDEDEL